LQLAHQAGAVATCCAESYKEIAVRAGADDVLLTDGNLVNLNELLGSLSEFAALLPALILRMLLASLYQQGRLRPFFGGFCQDFA
jgi:hypothetical protein